MEIYCFRMDGLEQINAIFNLESCIFNLFNIHIYELSNASKICKEPRLGIL